MGSVVVTHPFHPLCGQRLGVVFTKRSRRGLVFVCEVDGQRRLPLPQDWTDRGAPARRERLSAESLTALRALIDSVCRGDQPVAESE